ncbi:MAG: glycosyltransferase family 2 protein [Bacteroidota bacterium]|nr:glycosyltransferase family 2 protein [Bacteroidota bacterium]
MRVSVIISTYNSPEWLEKVLHGYSCQEYKNFEVIIADDGSGPETRSLIARFKKQTSLEIHHVWHEDKGYRRQTILNKAILATHTSYIIFTDGDCIPRNDFVGTHVRHARKGFFLSGGYCKLSMDTSRAISKETILNQKAFDVSWLRSIGPLGLSQARKLKASGRWAQFLDFITPANASFNNCNSSAWKSDLVAINGYDERMQYGGSDREIGERLVNYGVGGLQIRHRAIVVHLDHPRGYKTKDSLKKNLDIRKTTRREKVKWTEYGIVQGARHRRSQAR